MICRGKSSSETFANHPDQRSQASDIASRVPPQSSVVKRRDDELTRDSAWQWGHGSRSDPFKVLSRGGGSGSAVAMDFGMHTLH